MLIYSAFALRTTRVWVPARGTFSILDFFSSISLQFPKLLFRNERKVEQYIGYVFGNKHILHKDNARKPWDKVVWMVRSHLSDGYNTLQVSLADVDSGDDFSRRSGGGIFYLPADGLRWPQVDEIVNLKVHPHDLIEGTVKSVEKKKRERNSKIKGDQRL